MFFQVSHLPIFLGMNDCILLQHMRVRVQKFREAGRRLTDVEIANSPAIVGELSTYRMNTTFGSYKAAQIVQMESGGLRTPLAVLYEPELLQILNGSILLRGLETLDSGQTVLQEWLCQLAL